MLKLFAFLLCLGLAACSGAPAAPRDVPARGEVRVAASADPDVAAFYAARGQRPLWSERGLLGPEALRLARRLAAAADDGLDPADYRARELGAAIAAARGGDAAAMARADLLLSEALVRYARDLRTPAEAARPIYAEPGLEPEAPEPRALLDRAAGSLGSSLDAALKMNPVYEGLRTGLAAYRRRWSRLPQVAVPEGPALAPGAAGERVARLRRRLGLAQGDRFDAPLARAVAAFKAAHGLPGNPLADAGTIAAMNRGAAYYERLILANLERARAIPARPSRFVLVDAAAARLWMFEGDRPAGWMRVIVGKPAMSTPALAARIRYAVLNPYWNVPVDLARDRARAVLRRGTRVLAQERLQVLSQFSAADRVLSPASVDWRAVAAGREPLRLRQLPGGANVMGEIKFMMPNDRDIYLHDFPDKSLFARPDRRISSGCVRLEDAQRLARWLFGGTAPRPDGRRPEQRVDLPEPVPVYIVYLTAVPAGGEIAFQPDPYARDAALLAALERGRGAPA